MKLQRISVIYMQHILIKIQSIDLFLYKNDVYNSNYNKYARFSNKSQICHTILSIPCLRLKSKEISYRGESNVTMLLCRCCETA